MMIDGHVVTPGDRVKVLDGPVIEVQQVVENYTEIKRGAEPYIRGFEVEKGGILGKFRVISRHRIEKVL